MAKVLCGEITNFKEIGIEEYSDIMDTSEVIHSLDMGSAIIHEVTLQNRSGAILINTVCGRAGVLYV